MREPVYTIGHSTHSADKFVALLKSQGVCQLADVRFIPKSARHPHFSREPLSMRLEAEGIRYRHFVDLGGHRKPSQHSVNTAWKEDAFRGYADHMSTASFRTAVDALLAFAADGRTSVMCAEAAWWQCHRRLLADYLLVRGVPVLHIAAGAPPKPHEFSDFAREADGGVIYRGLL